MPEWKFLVLRKIGNLAKRQIASANIKKQVEKLGMSTVFPQIKYERGKQTEYYLGLAVDSNALPDGEAEKVGREILARAGDKDALNPHTCFTVTADAAKSLLTGAIGIEKIATSISYQPKKTLETPPAETLLSFVESGEYDSELPDDSESIKYSRLLYWCSSVGTGRLDRFKDACQLIGLDQEWGGAWSIMRKLVLLGHLEFDGGANFKWSVLKPTAYGQIQDNGYSVLVGQRNNSILERIASETRIYQQKQVGGPPALLLERQADEIPSYHPSIPEHLGPVAEHLCDNLPYLDQWIDIIPTWEENDLARYSIEEYDPFTDSFTRIPQKAGISPSTMYRFHTDLSYRTTTTHALYNEAQQRWLCGDFYGIRFLARNTSGNARCLYSVATNRLFIPIQDRWPMPYERALVLASGLLPTRLKDPNGTQILIYDGITHDFAIRMSSLLNLELEGDICST